jgi:hypothetical protein
MSDGGDGAFLAFAPNNFEVMPSFRCFYTLKTSFSDTHKDLQISPRRSAVMAASEGDYLRV